MRCLAALLLSLLPADARPWTEDVLYFVLTDRFHDGDPANNTPAGSDPLLYDPLQKNIGMYQGGDLRGLEQALESGYFNELGVTALWITPPVKNVWRSGYDLGGWKTGYHGYWTQDFLDIDPHLTSAVSMKGEKYPDSAEGRMRHYRDFVALAHAKGLKVIQDVVLNHSGPVFFYDVDGDGVFDDQSKDEWVQPFKRDGFNPNAVWANTAKWNLMKAQPDGPRDLLGRKIATKGVLAELSSYGRKGFSPESLGKSDGEEIECDFFSLRDLWTAPGSAHFDRLVNEFVEIYAFYLLDVGIDGLRVDTVKHVHHEFWDAFTERLRKRLGAKAKDKLLFGEVYDGDPKKLGSYTWRSDAPKRKEPCLDSVLDFQTCFAARDYLRREGGEHGSAEKLERAMKALREENDGRPLYNPNPGLDGKNAREKSITFIENHDGLNRFRVAGVTAERNDLAQALVLLLPGIPCIYYGAEVALHDVKGKVGQDTESGRLTLFPREAEPQLGALKGTPSFQVISRAAALRREMPVLRDGEFKPLWVDSPQGGEDDGVFAFCREKKGEKVMVVFNAAGSPREPKLPAAGFAVGTKLKVTPVCGTSPVSDVVVGADGRVEVSPGANTALILRSAEGGNSAK